MLITKADRITEITAWNCNGVINLKKVQRDTSCPENVLIVIETRGDGMGRLMVLFKAV